MWKERIYKPFFLLVIPLFKKAIDKKDMSLYNDNVACKNAISYSIK